MLKGVLLLELIIAILNSSFDHCIIIQKIW